MANQPPATNTYSLPTSLQHASPASPQSPARKPWLQYLSSLRNSHPQYRDGNEQLRQSNTITNISMRSGGRGEKKWWKIRLFRGMINDVRRRAPFYWSDWTDAWDYRVVPATVYMYFAKYVYFVISYQGLKLKSLFSIGMGTGMWMRFKMRIVLIERQYPTCFSFLFRYVSS